MLAALREFGARPFDAVGVGELAAMAETTTGALYHHFGSKAGLYAVVRLDVEQRLLDRMEGALASTAGSVDGAAAAIPAALTIGLEFAVEARLPHLLGTPPTGDEPDRLAELLAARVAPAPPLLGSALAAAWRATLLAVADGTDLAEARETLAALSVSAPAHP